MLGVLLLVLGGCGGEDEGVPSAPAPIPAAEVPDEPNFVVVMTDDQDVASAQSMETVQAELVDEGVEFENSFVGLSECCPSRVTFLTGQHAHNHGVETSRPPDGGYPALDSTNTLPVWLDDAGYRTGQVGRYVNYYGNSAQGTDPREVPPGWDDWHVPVEHTEFQVYDYLLNENGELVQYGSAPEDYATDVFAGKAVDFIESSAEEADPFFLWVTPNVPHSEGVLDDVDAPRRNPRPAPGDDGALEGEAVPESPSFMEDTSDKPEPVRSAENLTGEQPDAALEGEYLGRMESLIAVDRMVGDILAALERTGELDDTYVIFTSDNGYLLGEHRQTGKHLLFEESIRVPLAVRGPGIEPGTARAELVQNIDLAPTIIALAGARAGLEADGVALFGPDDVPDPARDLLIEYPSSRLAYSAVRTPDGFSYAEYESGGTELYDLGEDPYQLTNVAGDPDYEETERDLAERLARLRDCAGEACR